MPVWIIIAYCIVSILCVFSAIKLFRAGTPAYGKAVVGTYVLYTAVLIAIFAFKIRVPSYQVLLSMLTVLGSCFLGHGLQLYNKSRVFDRYLHAFGTFSFALFTYSILDDFITPGGSRVYRALFVFLLGNTLGVVFEMTEMLQDAKRSAPKSQHGLRDTNMDQLFNLLGSALAWVVTYF